MATSKYYQDREILTLLFCVDREEERETLSVFRAAFGAATELEAVTEDVLALHIRPGHPGCLCDTGGAPWTQR